MQSRQAKLGTAFKQHFGQPPSVFFQAPGRVNLIGEHTDYNDGFVLPCAIDYTTMVAVRPRSDSTVRVIAEDFDQQLDTLDLSQPITFNAQLPWSNYVRGVLQELQQRGHKLTGADLLISGNVPKGAGLSSSASLEVVVAETFNGLCDLGLSKAEMALIGQAAENEFVGCNCGIMDQMVSATGRVGHAVLLDCRSLETQLIPVPKDMAVMIIDSNVKRGLVDSEYNLRREQCEQAAKILGIPALRDIDLPALERHRDDLSAEVYKRAHHVVSENQRTLLAADALAHAEYATLAHLMAESHASMRDDFQITVPPIDYIVELLSGFLGERGGVRMTGGGFGGCVVALLPEALLSEAKALLAAKYQVQTGYQATVYHCHASAGAGLLPV